LQPAKLYKLKHLSKVEVLTNDPSGCTFTLVMFPNRKILCSDSTRIVVSFWHKRCSWSSHSLFKVVF
jgi:hypothetical protein